MLKYYLKKYKSFLRNVRYNQKQILFKSTALITFFIRSMVNINLNSLYNII